MERSLDNLEQVSIMPKWAYRNDEWIELMDSIFYSENDIDYILKEPIVKSDSEILLDKF